MPQTWHLSDPACPSWVRRCVEETPAYRLYRIADNMPIGVNRLPDMRQTGRTTALAKGVFCVPHSVLVMHDMQDRDRIRRHPDFASIADRVISLPEVERQRFVARGPIIFDHVCYELEIQELQERPDQMLKDLLFAAIPLLSGEAEPLEVQYPNDMRGRTTQAQYINRHTAMVDTLLVREAAKRVLGLSIII